MYCSIDTWGPATWTALHCMASSYPTQPDKTLQKKTKLFLETFAELIPCKMCGAHFQSHVANLSPGDLASRDAFLSWTVHVHNEVNERTGKATVKTSDVPQNLNNKAYESASQSTCESKTVHVWVLVVVCVALVVAIGVMKYRKKL